MTLPPGSSDPLFAFLADIWEQADLMRQSATDPVSKAVLEELQGRITGLALVAQTAASSKAKTSTV